MRTRAETLAKRDAEALAIMDAESASNTGFRIDEDTGEPNDRAKLVLHAGGWDVGEFVAALARAANERFILLSLTGSMPGAADVAVRSRTIRDSRMVGAVR